MSALHAASSRRPRAAFLLVAVLAAGCSGSDAAPESTPAATDAPTTTLPALSDAASARLAALDDGAPRPDCDPLGLDDPAARAAACYLPFPSDFFTVEDEATDTGRRVALPSVMRNVSGTTFDLTEWNRNDGFSPNTPILVDLPGLDASTLPPWTDIARSLADDSPVVLVDVTDGERIALWAEVDSHGDAGAQLLSVRPAVSLPEGHTFAIGLRGLTAADGTPIAVDPDFEIYRSGTTSTSEWFESRRPAMDAAFDALEWAGVARADLQLAWTFTVASTRSISERMLHIRDTALAALGASGGRPNAPAYTIAAVTPSPREGIAFQVTGTYTVPNFLTADGGPGNRFHYDTTDPDALPTQNGTLEAPFACNVSQTTFAGTTPAHLVQYGHGLLGSNFEIDAGNVRAFANEHDVVFCATKWAGMSEDDIGNAAATLQEMSNFPTLADRLQQGVLNQIFLGRLMIGVGGLGDDATFRRADGTPMLDTSELDYDGNSQGGIMGLMLAAVSPDIDRVVLGVPGMNYSLLLPRSVDFDTYEDVMRGEYPDSTDRTIIFALVQMLWDRGEGAGYVQHVTENPYAGTSAKVVLLHVAFGDQQVTELSALVEARTLGAAIHRPVAGDGRWAEIEAGWGLESITYPWDGSAIIVWDSGMAPIPFENLAPREGDDSHEDPRADADVRVQKAAFLFDHQLIDVCNGAACTADHRS